MPCAIACAAAKSLQKNEIAVSDKCEEKANALAEKLGADITIDPLTENISKVLADNGIKRIDTVIECVGKPATIEQAISIAGNKSTVMMFGLTKPGDTVEIRPFEIFKKEIVLKASFINPYTQKRALSLIASGRIDVSSMIHETVSVDELPALLADKQRRMMGKHIAVFP